MVKRTLLVVAVVVLLSCPAIKADGLALWGLTHQDVKSAQTSMSGRIGYQVNDIEAFIGYTLWPDREGENGEEGPPDVFSLGSVYHLPDLVDPNNPLPWIPELLLLLIPEGFLAQPYTGGQATWNVGNAAGGFYGWIGGLLLKINVEDRSAFVLETTVNHNFGDLSAVSDEWQLYLGMRFLF